MRLFTLCLCFILFRLNTVYFKFFSPQKIGIESLLSWCVYNAFYHEKDNIYNSWSVKDSEAGAISSAYVKWDKDPFLNKYVVVFDTSQIRSPVLNGRIKYVQQYISLGSDIVFRERRPGDRQYVVVEPYGNGCMTYYGKNYGDNYGVEKRLRVTLPAWCWHTGVIIHEVLHSLGFIHEHQRWDRYNYIYFQTTSKQLDIQYVMLPLDDKLKYSPYDVLSVMHYSNSRNHRERFFTNDPRLNKYIHGGRTFMSSCDWYALNLMYPGRFRLKGCRQNYRPPLLIPSKQFKSYALDAEETCRYMDSQYYDVGLCVLPNGMKFPNVEEELREFMEDVKDPITTKTGGTLGETSTPSWGRILPLTSGMSSSLTSYRSPSTLSSIHSGIALNKTTDTVLYSTKTTNMRYGSPGEAKTQQSSEGTKAVVEETSSEGKFRLNLTSGEGKIHLSSTSSANVSRGRDITDADAKLRNGHVNFVRKNQWRRRKGLWTRGTRCGNSSVRRVGNGFWGNKKNTWARVKPDSQNRGPTATVKRPKERNHRLPVTRMHPDVGGGSISSTTPVISSLERNQTDSNSRIKLEKIPRSGLDRFFGGSFARRIRRFGESVVSDTLNYRGDDGHGQRRKYAQSGKVLPFSSPKHLIDRLPRNFRDKFEKRCRNLISSLESSLKYWWKGRRLG